MDEKLLKALNAWSIWYSERLDRISTEGSKEDYSGYEQDLFEALHCQAGDLTPEDFEV